MVKDEKGEAIAEDFAKAIERFAIGIYQEGFEAAKEAALKAMDEHEEKYRLELSKMEEKVKYKPQLRELLIEFRARISNAGELRDRLKAIKSEEE